jgi:hypothetical protein
MLPAPEDFDGFMAATFGVLARLRLIEQMDERLAVLRERSARARALAVLELFEETRRYDSVMTALRLSRPRVGQLLSDGRLWREYDAAQQRQATE